MFKQHPHAHILLAYLRVFALSVAAFVVCTTEFIPIALLTDIRRGFDMPAADTGIMITVYAWVVSLASLPLMLLVARLERRRLLLALFAVFVAGHALSALAWSFPVLLASRVLIALTHALFWAMTASLVMRMAPIGRRQQALGWLSLGTSMATVLGLPLGRLVGQWLGWRATFALIGVLALGVMVLLAKILPILESRNAGSLSSLPLLAKRPRLLGMYAMAVLAVSAHFTAYSYIEPYALEVTHMPPDTATMVLLVFGLSGMVASWLFARFYPKHPQPTLLLAALLLVVSLLLLRPLGGSEAAMFALAPAWGIGIAVLSLCMTAYVMRYARDAADVANAIYSGSYNIGIGGGALLGGMVMRHWGWARWAGWAQAWPQRRWRCLLGRRWGLRKRKVE
ncbi:sugar transporter [Eikenella sp. Marseille-P7795]|uniref:sugar transporter n=1 Tax=Eikenella sp. Marseille-P7795 TaxID=2866577 RepID=UPI001CE4253E|nr:sugar transporter [Eikenella sp. Marseille-P7795]